MSIIFSIITPVYNDEKYIEETILSVLDKIDKSNTEYIIVNDGSTDSTKTILERYKTQIIIINQRNLGEASAVNLGIKKAIGKYCLVLSSDDPFLSNKLLNESFSLMEKNSEIVCVYPDWKVIDHNGREIAIVKVQDFSMTELVGRFNCLVGPGGVFRRDIAVKIRGRNPVYKYVSDYDFWLRMSQHGIFAHIKATLAQWRQHENSTSVKRRGFDMALERITVISDFIKISDFDRKFKFRALGNAYYHASLLNYFDNLVPGKLYLMKAIILNFRNMRSDFKFKVIAYIYLLPISKYLIKVLRGLDPKK